MKARLVGLLVLTTVTALCAASSAQAARSSFGNYRWTATCQPYSSCLVKPLLPYYIAVYQSNGATVVDYRGLPWHIQTNAPVKVPVCMSSVPAHTFAQTGDNRYSASTKCATLDNAGGPYTIQDHVNAHPGWLNYVRNSAHWIRVEVINLSSVPRSFTLYQDFGRYCLDLAC